MSLLPSVILWESASFSADPSVSRGCKPFESRGRDCPVTEAVLQGWPLRQVGGVRGQVPERGGPTVGGSMNREGNRHVRRVEAKQRAAAVSSSPAAPSIYSPIDADYSLEE